ncbi:response regulator [Candidatus Omnitrophota bacterium]
MAQLLIVDDEPDVREFACNFFKKRKVDVATASGGNEAIAFIKQQKPQLILLDIRMEDMNGLDVLEEIKKIDSSIKVIMVTGVDEEESMQRAKKLGALNYVHKPLVLDELEEVVLRELS